MAENTTGYFGVVLDKSCKTKLASPPPRREAALCIPERNVAAERAAAVERAAAALPLSEEQLAARKRS